jgi:alkylation response protein AidB-like acyl-CoA dehydrogenase
MDFEESEEQRMLRAAVGSVAARYGHDYYVDRSRTGKKTDELWDELASAGYLGVNVPEQFGGGGQGITELAIVEEELAAQGCPLLLLVVSPAICATIISAFGTDQQRERWLPGIGDGSLKMAFAITEPDAGSNSHNISTMAARDGDVYRLNGTKYYISGCDESQAVLVVTRTSTDEDTGRGRLSLFVVDLDAAGLEMTPIPVEIVAPEKQFTLFFDNVEVPADRLIGEEGEGLRQVFLGLNPERIMTASIATGVGRYALEKAARYARDLARLMCQKAAWACDTDADPQVAGEAANMAKYAAAEAALAALDQAIQVHGGNGMSSEFGLADMWGMTRLMRTAPVSKEMILNYVSQHSLGLPKSY